MQPGRSIRVAVDDCWVAGRFSGPVVLEADERGADLVPVPPDAAGVLPLGGTMLPGFVDHHTHLGLVDPAGFSHSPVVEVHDLGWCSAELAAALCRPDVDARMPGPLVRIPWPRPASTSALPDWFASARRWQAWPEEVSTA